MTQKLTLLASLALALPGSAAVVYEDAFDGDGIGTNAGTGGGMASFTISQNSFVDAPATGGLIAGTSTNAARRTVASTNSSFDLSGGATIEIHWQGTTNKTGYYDFSLSPNKLAGGTGGLTTSSEGIFTQFGAGDGDTASSREGFGFAWGSFRGQDGLYQNDGLGRGSSITTLENDGGGGTYNSTATNTIFLLTVNADGSYGYTVTGNAVTTASGTGVAGSIDLTGDRYLNVYAQPTGQFNYAKITTVPEPSAALLGGLGLLGLLRRRRK